MARWGLFLALLPGLPAFAQGRIDCAVIESAILRRPVRYCADLPARNDDLSRRSYPILYFLHGLGDDEQTLLKSGGWTLIDDLRQQGKIGDFLVVAPQGRRSFYINSADGRERYSDFFLQEFMPYVEKKYGVHGGRAGRAITGISMGGYGALRLAFAHPELFSSVSAQSAALLVESPAELNQAVSSGSPIAAMLGDVFGNPIDVPHWQANNPYVLARKNQAALRNLAIYFNCGQSDDYGFQKGAALLDRQLAEEGIRHEYHAYPGDHSLSYFLSHLGETMEFHSRWFTQPK
ncbi:MAG TPA: alpha/beta hydrolase family protein [Terriglobales bacterium]|nr:alpha/beta hydrolase family protein [Terriglobales bacterium]